MPSIITDFQSAQGTGIDAQLRPLVCRQTQVPAQQAPNDTTVRQQQKMPTVLRRPGMRQQLIFKRL
jgi:hypothetical protein